MNRATSVLIVGEEPDLRASLARDLTESGFEAHTCSSVDDALAKLGQRSIDVLLSDLHIHSDRDGLDLLKRASEIASGTRAVMMSVAASAQDYQTATHLGAVRILWKPILKADLLAA